VSAGPEQAPTDQFGGTGADHGGAKHKHGRDHDHCHAAKAGERLLRAQDGCPLTVRSWPWKGKGQHHEQRGDVRPQPLRPEEVKRP
jgi:hypothetical protein